MKKINTLHIFVIFLLIILFDFGHVFGAVTNVTVSLIDNPTILSNGHSYFLAGRDYRVRVQASSTDCTQASDWGNIVLTFTGGATCTVAVSTLPAALTSNAYMWYSATATSTNSNLDVTITIRFLWDIADFAEATNSITATVDQTLAPIGSNSDTLNLPYGLSTHVQLLNLQATGDAADLRINPYHLTFDITGDEVIYYTPDGGTGAADSVRTLATAGAGEITATTMLRNGAVTAIIDNDEVNTAPARIDYVIPASYFNTFTGNQVISARITMNNNGSSQNVDTSTFLTINCDEVQVNTITFFNGGGLNAPYFRNINVPGTQIQITAQMRNGGGTMVGNTTFTVQCRNAANVQIGTFTVQILSGQGTGIALVTSPIAADIADGSTEIKNYRIISITGSAYDDEQNILATPGSIQQPAVVNVYWDRNDPPGTTDNDDGSSTPFTTGGYTSNTATSLTFTWAAVTDLDFYTYRIYYRESGGSWIAIDRSVTSYGPAGTYDLSTAGTTSATISGLKPFTQYDYYITAVDIFGQEVDTTTGFTDAAHNGTAGADYHTVTTDPLQVDVTITDSITSFPNTAFDGEVPPVPGNRPLRKSAIRIDIFWASAQGEPDEVNIILSTYDISNPLNSELISGGDLPPLIEGTDYDRIRCTKTAPNKYTAYIPSGNRYMVTGNNLEFIVESRQLGSTSYVDHDSDTDASEQLPGAGDPNDIPWTFSIIAPPEFDPWPTRMLNNVITDENPRTYPSYYLTDDAYVTITAYDIKGRVVAILLDNAFRKAGQNIKEGGWDGSNKFKKKLGVGLYYIRIKAVRASDGKVIIDKYSKVVVAR